VDPVTEAPAFMADDLPAEPPAATPEELAVGSPVVVIQPSYNRRGKESPIPAIIADKARVWATVTRTEGRYPTSWRLRLDDQTDGSGSHYAVRFRTPAQHRYHEAYSEAIQYLHDQRLHIELNSPWRGRELELARIIWRGQNVKS